ncbi:MAG: hypothetical protein RL076_2853 [Chloroflexota bacterium]
MVTRSNAAVLLASWRIQRATRYAKIPEPKHTATETSEMRSTSTPGIWILMILMKISAGLRAYMLTRLSERVSIGRNRFRIYPTLTTTTIGNKTCINAWMSTGRPFHTRQISARHQKSSHQPGVLLEHDRRTTRYHHVGVSKMQTLVHQPWWCVTQDWIYVDNSLQNWPPHR